MCEKSKKVKSDHFSRAPEPKIGFKVSRVSARKFHAVRTLFKPLLEGFCLEEIQGP